MSEECYLNCAYKRLFRLHQTRQRPSDEMPDRELKRRTRQNSHRMILDQRKSLVWSKLQDEWGGEEYFAGVTCGQRMDWSTTDIVTVVPGNYQKWRSITWTNQYCKKITISGSVLVLQNISRCHCKAQKSKEEKLEVLSILNGCSSSVLNYGKCQVAYKVLVFLG